VFGIIFYSLLRNTEKEGEKFVKTESLEVGRKRGFSYFHCTREAGRGA
jgi:hypothetical protein